MENSEPHKKPIPQRILRKLGNTALAGVVVAVPLVVTLMVLSVAYQAINAVSAPIYKALGWNIPGIGFLTTLLIVLFLGFMATNVLGKQLIEAVENLLLRVPIVSQLYGAVKQALESFKSIRSQKKFKSVAYVPYPSEGYLLIGFVTGSLYDPVLRQDMTTVFLPTSPNPLTGFVLAIPNDKVIESGLSLEQATKLIVSIGLVAPGKPVDYRTPEEVSGVSAGMAG